MVRPGGENDLDALRNWMETPGSATIRLDLPSRIDLIEVADRLASDLAAIAGFDPDSTEDIRTAVHESVMNAMTHGNLLDPARRVKLDLVLHPGALEIRIQDEGRGFEPSEVPDPLARENLTKPSGRGILLMRALMDAVTFRRPASGGTRVRMLKRLRRAAGDGAPTQVGQPESLGA